jgi:hypothetical protein
MDIHFRFDPWLLNVIRDLTACLRFLQLTSAYVAAYGVADCHADKRMSIPH